MTHRTHAQQLARDLADATGLGYQQALDLVRSAIDDGTLTGPLSTENRPDLVRQLTERIGHPAAPAEPAPILRCGWLGDNGRGTCRQPAERVIVFGDEPHLACAAHADAERDDLLVGVLGLLDPPVALAAGTWLIATGESTAERELPVIAWNEPDAGNPDGRRSVCAWFDSENPASAPVRWRSFDAYYEVLCDPAELDSDDAAGALAAAQEVLGYVRRLHPDPSVVQVFRCAWLPEYDGVGEVPPDHGWALVVPVSVRAGVLDDSLTGSDITYSVSAHGIVDANSWTGAEHGWGVGCAHLLTIVPAGERPELMMEPLTQ